MTDLKKGIIEINGVEISSKTTSFDVIRNLKNIYANRAVSKNGDVEIFRFEEVTLLNRQFKIKVTFINKKLTDLKLISYYKKNLSYEEKFKADCEWLKSILGEPTKTGSNGVSYRFESVQIGATLWECDGRIGPDEYIKIRF